MPQHPLFDITPEHILALDDEGLRLLIAHNASFDRRFWEAELRRIGRRSAQPFACSMLLARRLLPEAPNHKLGTLVEYARLPVTGRSHRAQADAEMAAHLRLYLEQHLIKRFGLAAVTHPLLGRIPRTPKGRLEGYLGRYAQVGA